MCVYAVIVAKFHRAMGLPYEAVDAFVANLAMSFAAHGITAEALSGLLGDEGDVKRFFYAGTFSLTSASALRCPPGMQRTLVDVQNSVYGCAMIPSSVVFEGNNAAQHATMSADGRVLNSDKMVQTQGLLFDAGTLASCDATTEGQVWSRILFCAAYLIMITADCS